MEKLPKVGDIPHLPSLDPPLPHIKTHVCVHMSYISGPMQVTKCD